MPLINNDGSHFSGDLFTSRQIPKGLNTLSPPGSNVQSAAGIYPSSLSQNGGKKNKIFRKYKMNYSNCKHKRKNHSHRRKNHSHRHKKHGHQSRKRYMRGGANLLQPMTTPNYPKGHEQFNNNNGSLSNSYSRGGFLSPSLSALAMPAPFKQLFAGNVDNLKHSTLNSFGKSGAGSGFPSRGWF
jgi:hypothetical protein